MSHRYKTGKRSAKQDIPLAREYLNIAKNELKGARALYDTGVYPGAVFSLQQSMEKGWKSFGFYFGIITEEDAKSRDVGHKGTRVCNKSIRLLQRIVSRLRQNMQSVRSLYNVRLSEAEQNSDFLNQLDSGINQTSIELTSFATDEEKYRNLSLREIREIIEEITIMLQVIDRAEKILNDPSFSSEHYDEIRKNAVETGLQTFHGIPQAGLLIQKLCSELNNEKIKKIIDAMIKGEAVVTPLLSLAILTQPHEQSTRYIIDGQSPQQIYTASHPLVHEFPAILQIAEKTLENLDAFYVALPQQEATP